METRNGFFKPEQEKKISKMFELSGIYQFLLRPVITLFDNMVLHRLKKKYLKEKPEALPIIYEFVDDIFDSIEKDD